MRKSWFWPNFGLGIWTGLFGGGAAFATGNALIAALACLAATLVFALDYQWKSGLTVDRLRAAAGVAVALAPFFLVTYALGLVDPFIILKSYLVVTSGGILCLLAGAAVGEALAARLPRRPPDNDD